MEEACDQFEQDRTEVQEYRKLKNDSKKELQLVEEILRLHFGYEEVLREKTEPEQTVDERRGNDQIKETCEDKAKERKNDERTNYENQKMDRNRGRW